MQPYGLLEGCLYEDLSKFTAVFNTYALDDYIWVHLPSWIQHYKLESIYNIGGQYSKEITYDEAEVSQDFPRPWIKIKTSLLDLTSGQHIYKLKFRAETHFKDTDCIFISYIAQDNNPKTPYIYMPNRGNPESIDTTEYNYEEEYVTDD